MDREKVIKELEEISDYFFDIYRNDTDSYKCEKAQEYSDVAIDAIALLKEQQNLLGIQQTADGITFLSTGTAKQGEERGLMLGKLTMHEWLKKELLYRGLLTDEIRAVFDEAKRI